MVILAFLAGVLVCGLAVTALNAREIRAARKRRRKEREEHPEKKIQATKVIVFSIRLTYLVAFILGIWVVIEKDYYQLSVLLTFIGSVSVFAVAFYCWKSKAENLEKIKKNNPDLMGSLSDFGNMGSQ